MNNEVKKFLEAPGLDFALAALEAVHALGYKTVTISREDAMIVLRAFQVMRAQFDDSEIVQAKARAVLDGLRV